MHAYTRTVTAGALAAGLWLCAQTGAQAQAPGNPAGPPPSWDSLIPCAQKSDPKEGFACYQAAMRAAGYAPNAEVVEADKRRKFGLNLPTPFKHSGEKPKQVARAEGKAQPAPAPSSPQAAAPAEEDQAQVSVQLSQVALIPPQNRLLLVTQEGAIWEQTDDEAVSPRPKPGQTIRIEQNRFGGYFCRFDKFTKVRCTRTH
jgi:hypothetical protein